MIEVEPLLARRTLMAIWKHQDDIMHTYHADHKGGGGGGEEEYSNGTAI